MKKFISLILLLTFISSQNLIFAASMQRNTQNTNNTTIPANASKTKQYKTIDNKTRKQNMELNRQMQNNPYANTNIQYLNQQYNSQQYNNSYANEVILDTNNTNAFSNNYQNANQSANIADLSQVEQIFNGKDVDVSNNVLRQVGYDLFNLPMPTTTSTTGKFDGNYKLSVGEKVSIYLYGDTVDVIAVSGTNLLTPVVKTEVDSTGNIFVQGLGIIPAENRTIAEVEQAMNRIASNKYESLKVRLSISSGQEISVFVYGQVKRPGKVYVSNNSSLIDALGAAGGVKKTGSLRNITYTTGRKKHKVDLYNAIFSGEDSDIILKANDKIFVDGIGKVIALKNGVSVPGIYETKESDNLQKLINFAGGLLPGTQTKEVTITSLDSNTLERSAKTISWDLAKNSKLQSGDTVEFRELYNTAENTVTLQGNVKHPATYAYKPGMRLSDILPNEKELLEETFISQAVIRRISGSDNKIETIPVFLKEFFSGANDPVLQPRDIINVYKNTNSEFVDIYGCISIPKHIPYVDDMRLDDVLTDIQFVESTLDEEDDTSDTVNKSPDGTVLVAGTTNNNKLISAEEVAVEIIGQDNTIQVYYLYDIMVNSYKMDTISLMPYDKVFFRKLREDEKIKNVKVTGYVKNPTSFKFVEGQNLKDLIIKAGGLKKDADLRGIVYIRKSISDTQVELARQNSDRDISLLEGRLASGFKQSATDMAAKANVIEQMRTEKGRLKSRFDGRIVLNIKSNDLNKLSKSANIEAQDGDIIFIPRMPKHVSVQGEVYNEKSFAYEAGKTYRQYIKDVGGYTPNASKIRAYKVGVNGKAKKVHLLTKIAVGDTIIVPRKIAANDWITPVCSTLQGIAAILTGVFVATKI